MDNILVKITEIEKQAREIVAEAQRKSDRLDEDVAAELEAYRVSVYAAARETLAAAGKEESAAYAEKLRELTEKTHSGELTMRGNCDRFGEQWADALVKKIIERDI